MSIKGREIWFRIIHGIVATNERLAKFRIINNRFCSYCKDQIEDIEHLFFMCPVIKQAKDYINVMLGRDLEAKEVIHGEILIGKQNISEAIVTSEYLEQVWKARVTRELDKKL